MAKKQVTDVNMSQVASAQETEAPTVESLQLEIAKASGEIARAQVLIDQLKTAIVKLALKL